MENRGCQVTKATLKKFKNQRIKTVNAAKKYGVCTKTALKITVKVIL